MTLVFVRIYAGAMGLALTLLSVMGLMGVWNVETGRFPFLLGTAVIYFLVSLGTLGAKETRAVIGALGLLYLLAGGVLFVSAVFFGDVPPDAREVEIILTRVSLGIPSIFVWLFFRDKESTRG